MIYPKLFAVLILSCSLTGCLISAQIPGVCGDETRLINPNESNVPAQQLIDAASWWNEVSGKRLVVVTTVFAGNVSVVEVPQLPEQYDRAVGLAYARYSDDGSFESCPIVLKEFTWTQEKLRHELGHCLGLGHDDPEVYPGSIMDVMVRCQNDCVVYPHHLAALPDCQLELSAEIQ